MDTASFIFLLAGVISSGFVIVLYSLTFVRYQYLESKLPEATRYEDLSLRLAEAEEDLRQCKTELRQAELKIEQANQLEERVAELKEFLEDQEPMRRECDRLKVELSQITEQVETKKQQVIEAEESVDRAKRQQQLAEHDRDTAVAEFEKVQRKCEECQNRLSALQQECRRLEGTQQQLIDLVRDCKLVESEISKLNDRRQHLTQSIEELSNRLNKLQDETRGLEVKHQQAHTKTQSALAQQTVEEDKLMRLRQEAIKLDREIKALKQQQLQLNQVRGDLESALKEFQKLDKEKRKAEDELKSLKSRLSKTRSDYQDTVANQRELQGTLSGLKKEIDSLQNACSTQKEALQSLQSLSGSKTKQSSEQVIWKPVLSSQPLATPLKDDERDALKRVLKHLKSHNLEYPQRVVYAFHTSLKVAPEAPLLVLAGISGTGKSQLPRRYAEALGMNFLSFAVQPGWDSPEDLLGFYNHLEGRFKATPLSRALVQMDPYGQNRMKKGKWPKVSEYSSSSDKMLLVLLDEMNLARIEYYFSEFLSRLEQRSTILQGIIEAGRTHSDFNESARSPAEIVFELGLGSEDGNSLPVFVSNNVLFCGTMNEDESTQSLSDKVLDRANVMRFAKPKKLMTHAKVNKGRLTSSEISHKTWLKWCAPKRLKTDQERNVESWIDRCNTSLQHIGRPFGHRLGRAIYRYVNLYPGNSDENLRIAMADQLEQRILPKLRGIDPQDESSSKALKQLVSLAEELKDSSLCEAIEAASRGSDGHYFSWQGVSREQ